MLSKDQNQPSAQYTAESIAAYSRLLVDDIIEKAGHGFHYLCIASEIGDFSFLYARENGNTHEFISPDLLSLQELYETLESSLITPGRIRVTLESARVINPEDFLGNEYKDTPGIDDLYEWKIQNFKVTPLSTKESAAYRSLAIRRDFLILKSKLNFNKAPLHPVRSELHKTRWENRVILRDAWILPEYPSR